MKNALNTPFNVGDFVRYIPDGEEMFVAYIDQIIVKFERHTGATRSFDSLDEKLTQIQPRSSFGERKEVIDYEMLMQGEESYILDTHEDYMELTFVSISYILICADAKLNKVVLPTEENLYPLSKYVDELAQGTHMEMQQMGPYYSPKMLPSLLAYLTSLEVKECLEESNVALKEMTTLLSNKLKDCYEKTILCYSTIYSENDPLSLTIQTEKGSVQLFYHQGTSHQDFPMLEFWKRQSCEKDDDAIARYRLYNYEKDELLEDLHDVIMELLVKEFDAEDFITNLRVEEIQAKEAREEKRDEIAKKTM